ncbi:BRCA1-associated protein isoform X3 [Phyllopteryx taeniolatus]|uniref:BRCA1-associated protein isoform X3 n=1 Tax=Phyllopteryx taeniolatus TaxID=161469 RepID=UPI002AD34241|nr:BRCA1-associated protein isoform X3 [Phyllopteryx taeniolatus]XP_061603189.1 BRCA1-associated protein isoform X3 [Phyllopteryx taeniolatus]
MSVSLVVIRLEIADQSPAPQGFRYSAAGDMSEEQLQDKSLTLGRLALSGKTEAERSAVLHQHMGSRSMGDMVIETFEPGPDKGGGDDPEGCADPDEDAAAAASLDSPSKRLPEQISFFSGNPSVEVVHGIMHLYKTDKMTSLTEDVGRSAMVCILTVPAAMTSHDLMKLMAPFNDVMEHMKIIRDSTPNQYMVLIKFSTQADADSFYTACNGRQFNSIEEAVCQLVYVERAEVFKSEEGAGLPVMELTELPKCTVCLERMDESVNGILTTLCNHSFHSQCLQRWEDASCPVCRYCQTPEPVEENKCFECGVQENLWICLICGHIGCGRYVSRHAYKHFEETQHTYAMQLTNHRVWDYAGDNYVHRLVASKTDGKMVQYECEGDTCQAEKVDALQLEVRPAPPFSRLGRVALTRGRPGCPSVLVPADQSAGVSAGLLGEQDCAPGEGHGGGGEPRRQRQQQHFSDCYWVPLVCVRQINNMKAKFKETLERCDNLERRLGEISKDKQSMEKKCTQLSGRMTKLSQELTEEQEMNKCLRANQMQLQTRLADEQRRAKESGEQKERAVEELQDQLRDVMFYLETQQHIQHLPEEARSEIQEGQINIAAGPAADGGPADAAAVGRGRRGRGRKRK